MKDKLITELIDKISNDQTQDSKDWNKEILPKVLLLLPTLLFISLFFKINSNQSLIDFFLWISFASLLIITTIIISSVVSNLK